MRGGCYFNKQVLVWAGPFPSFFRSEKKKKITMVPMNNIYFVFLILRNPPIEIGKLLRIYVAKVVLTNASLGFLGPRI